MVLLGDVSGSNYCQVLSDEDIPYIADGIDEGMFPDLTTVRCYLMRIYPT